MASCLTISRTLYLQFYKQETKQLKNGSNIKENDLGKMKQITWIYLVLFKFTLMLT